MRMTVFLHSISSHNQVAAADTPSGIGAALLKDSLNQAGWAPESLDLVIACSNTPDFNQPGLVHCLLPQLNWENSDRPQCAALELKHLGAGFFYALQFGHDVIATGVYSKVAVVTVDLLTRFFGGVTESDLTERQLAAKCWLADGAATCLLSREPAATGGSYRINEVSIKTDIRGREAFLCKAPQANHAGFRLTIDDLKNGRHLPELDLKALERFVPQLLRTEYSGSAEPILDLITGKLDLSGFGPGLEIGSARLEAC